jgi:serine/threonine protein phosphatase PrpC
VGRPLGLDEASLKIHPMRHVLTMAVGVGTTVRIRYYAVAIGPGDIMMLSSDGLHGVVGREEMEEILNNSPAGLNDKCQRLVTAANAAGSPDNVTVVLLRRSAA